MPARDSHARWDDLLSALDFAAAQFHRWHQTGLVRPDQASALAAHYQQRRQEALAARDAGQPPSPGIGLPPPADAPDETRLDAEQLRMWTFLGHEVRRHEEQRRLTLAQFHSCLNEVKGHVARLRRTVELASLPRAMPTDKRGGDPERARRATPPPEKAAPWFRILLCILYFFGVAVEAQVVSLWLVAHGMSGTPFFAPRTIGMDLVMAVGAAGTIALVIASILLLVRSKDALGFGLTGCALLWACYATILIVFAMTPGFGWTGLMWFLVMPSTGGPFWWLVVTSGASIVGWARGVK